TFVGTGVSYLIEHFFGPSWGICVAVVFTVSGVWFLVSGHTHKEWEPERGHGKIGIRKWVAVGSVLFIVTISVFTWKLLHAPLLTAPTPTQAFADRQIADALRHVPTAKPKPHKASGGVTPPVPNTECRDDKPENCKPDEIRKRVGELANG